MRQKTERQQGAAEPARAIQTSEVDSQKALDPKRPIREADIRTAPQ